MICPSCQSEQVVAENSFGTFYTCPFCQAVYFINFEGQPEYSSLELDPAAEILDSIELSSEADFSLPTEINAAPEMTDAMVFPMEGAIEVAGLDQQVHFADVAKDISDYGNTETQIAHLNYDLKIKGLDNSEMMKIFKEAIQDSRLGWDVSEMMKSVKNGEVQFKQLNPVKAYILAKRLQFLDVEKVWTQNAVG